MKTIQEAAHEYFRRGQLGLASAGSEYGFIAGVEYAQQWIDVEDELPKRVSGSFNDSDTVLIKVRIKNGTVKILTGHYDLSMKNWYIDAAHYNGIVIAWRPIEYK